MRDRCGVVEVEDSARGQVNSGRRHVGLSYDLGLGIQNIDMYLSLSLLLLCKVALCYFPAVTFYQVILQSARCEDNGLEMLASRDRRQSKRVKLDSSQSEKRD